MEGFRNTADRAHGYQDAVCIAEPRLDGDDEHNTAPVRQGKGFVLPAMFSQDGHEPDDTGIADRDGWLVQRNRCV